MYRTALLAVLAAATLVSCTGSEIDAASGREEMAVSAVMSAATKAPLSGTSFPQERDMVVSAYAPSAAADYFTAASFAFAQERGAWRATPKQFWPFGGSLDLLAFSCRDIVPVSVVWGEGNVTTSVTLAMPDNSVTQDDYLVGQKIGATKASASITFSHPQSQVRFTAASTVPFDEAANAGISIESVTLKEAYNAGTVKGVRSSEGRVAFEWLSLGAKKDVTLAPASPAPLGAEQTAVGAAFLVPQQYATAMTVRYILHNGRDADGRAVDVPLEYTYIPQATLWQAGRSYRYSMTFSLEGVSITASLTGWDDVAVPAQN